MLLTFVASWSHVSRLFGLSTFLLLTVSVSAAEINVPATSSLSNGPTIAVSPGDTLVLEAVGLWRLDGGFQYTGPDGSEIYNPWVGGYPVPDPGTGAALIGSWDGISAFYIGSGATTIIAPAGASSLILACNDNGHTDNQGSVDVTYGPTGFVRGDANANGVVSIDDSEAILGFLFEGGLFPLGCSLVPAPDVMDVNDNEYLTIADYLALRCAVSGGCVIPVPNSCELDPTEDDQGFSSIDAAFTVTTDPTVTGPVGSHVMFLPVQLDIPEPIVGVTLILEYDATKMSLSASTPYLEPGGVSVEWDLRDLGDRVVVTVWTVEDGDILRAADPGNWQDVGSLVFDLNPEVTFPPMTWSSEADVDGVPFRATIVGTDFKDHHPVHAVGIFKFARGDANNDGSVNIGDPIDALGYLFQGYPDSVCQDAVDANNDGRIDVADPIFLLSYLFGSGCIIVGPYPECGLDTGGPGCGGHLLDTDLDELTCDTDGAGCQ